MCIVTGILAEKHFVMDQNFPKFCHVKEVLTDDQNLIEAYFPAGGDSWSNSCSIKICGWEQNTLCLSCP